MWAYTDTTRDEFEKIKDHIEEIMVAHGAVFQDIDLPYSQHTTTVHKDSNAIVWEIVLELHLALAVFLLWLQSLHKQKD